MNFGDVWEHGEPFKNGAVVDLMGMSKTQQLLFAAAHGVGGVIVAHEDVGLVFTAQLNCACFVVGHQAPTHLLRAGRASSKINEDVQAMGDDLAIPTSGNAAARTALSHPPSTNQKCRRTPLPIFS